MRLRSFAVFAVLLFLTLRSGAADPLALHTGRYAMPVVVVGGGIDVIGGGGPSGYLSDIECIQPDGQVKVIPTSLLHRCWHTAQVQGRYIYILGGMTGTTAADAVLSAVVERYDVQTGAVTQMAPLPTPRHLAASLLIDGKIYVIGGSNGIPHGITGAPELGTLEIYDIKANAWTSGQPMPTPRECDLAVKDGVIYALGGYNGRGAVADVEAYDIASDSWRTLPSLPLPTSAHHVAVNGDSLILFGDYAQLDRVGAYSVKTGVYTPLIGTGYQPSRHNAVVVLNGIVYVIGGNTASGSGPLTLIQRFPLFFL